MDHQTAVSVITEEIQITTETLLVTASSTGALLAVLILCMSSIQKQEYPSLKYFLLGSLPIVLVGLSMQFIPFLRLITPIWLILVSGLGLVCSAWRQMQLNIQLPVLSEEIYWLGIGVLSSLTLFVEGSGVGPVLFFILGLLYRLDIRKYLVATYLLAPVVLLMKGVFFNIAYCIPAWDVGMSIAMSVMFFASIIVWGCFSKYRWKFVGILGAFQVVASLATLYFAF